jgi:glutamate synthase domain-containing protein 2
MILRIGALVWYALIAVSLLLIAIGNVVPAVWWGLVVTIPLTLLGAWDVSQRDHSVLRNYPLVGHLRFLCEDIGPEMHQYMVESNTQGRPFNRDQRSLMYARAKREPDQKAFGTELDVYGSGYTWINHSVAPRPEPADPVAELRVMVGGPQCSRRYSASVLNVSGMSFGALGASAILALNGGARAGSFAHNTGEGGISRYHREPGGDLIWQVGTGYFGCRTGDGRFDAQMFADQAQDDQVKMIEIKISQGAKPGHGGILPGAKVTAEIAEARAVGEGADCISPPYHTAFSTPIELTEFIGSLRELAGGKPIGIKLCIGHFSEFLGLCKAMIETEILPDFITVDGAEGGTGAAPLEFSDHVGTPLKEGIVLVRNALVGTGLKDRIQIAASGKTVSAFEMTSAMALGADWCNTARGFMFALGCLQTQRCHTNRCPVGITTQNARLQRALVVPEKVERVRNFHRNTVRSLGEVIAAAGLEDTSQLTPGHLRQRTSLWEIKTFNEIYEFVAPGELLEGGDGNPLHRFWQMASAHSFQHV